MQNVILSSANQSHVNSLNTRDSSNATSTIQESPKLNPNLKQDTVELSTKKQLKAKTIIGTATILGASIGILISILSHKKLEASKVKQLAEFVEFKPAQTMSEAQEFAKKNFGIEKFDFGDDLEMANWANEGLTNINNRSKGKAHMPKSICLEALDDNKIGGSCSHNDEIRINSDIFDTNKNLENAKPVFKMLDKNEINREFFITKNSLKKIHDAYQKHKSNPSQEFSRMEALKLAFACEDIDKPFTMPEKVLTTLLQNDKFTNALKEHNINLNLDDIKKLSQEEQQKILFETIGKIPDKELRSMDLYPSRFESEFDILYHEMGHLQHFKNTSLFSQFNGKFSYKPKQIAKFTQDPTKIATASKVSWYAQTHPNEFVAEVYAKLCNGVKLPDDVMKLYKKLGGVMI